MKTFNEVIEDCIQKLRYNEAAELVAQRLGLEWTVNFLKNGKHFEDDKDFRDIYRCTLKRGSREYSFNFGQSIKCSGEYQVKENLKNKIWVTHNTQGKICFTLTEFKKLPSYVVDKGDVHKNPNFKHPDLYAILCCLTKYDPGTFENFCSEFGYDKDSRKAYNTYTAVKEEYMNMCSLFNDEELELLNLIN